MNKLATLALIALGALLEAPLSRAGDGPVGIYEVREALHAAAGSRMQAEARLAALEAPVVEPLFQLWSMGAWPEDLPLVPGDAQTLRRPGEDLSEEDRQIIVSTLSGLHAELATYLRRDVVGAESRAPRVAALQLLGQIGRGSDLGLVTELASPAPRAKKADTTLCATFQLTVQTLLTKDEVTYSRAVREWDRMHPALRTYLLQALRVDAKVESLSVLLEVLAWPLDLEVRLLEEIDRLGDMLPLLEPKRVHDALSYFLFDQDPSVRCAAAKVCSHLRGPEVVGELMTLLEDDAAEVVEAALQSLRSSTGLGFPRSRARWRLWYEEEREWAREHRVPTLSDLGSQDLAAVHSALSGALAHRLYSADWEEPITALLDSVDADRRRLGCIGLAQLGSRRALPRLLEQLEDRDGSVRDAAQIALRTLTGLTAEPDRAAWAELLRDLPAAR